MFCSLSFFVVRREQQQQQQQTNKLKLIYKIVNSELKIEAGWERERLSFPSILIDSCSYDTGFEPVSLRYEGTHIPI